MLLHSCKATTGPFFSTHVGAIDYYSAGQNGKIFLTESNSVSFGYVPIGSIYMYQKSGYTKTYKDKMKTKEEGDPIYGTKKTTSHEYIAGDWKNADYQTLVTEASQQAIKMGGDGIINIQLSLHTDPNYPKISYPAISGMVIKRK